MISNGVKSLGEVYGGGRSLKRTVLRAQFPANRENYREISKFCSKCLPAKFSTVLNIREFLSRNHDF